VKFQIKYSNSFDLRFGNRLPPVIILKTLDVVLPKIASPLNFDENQLLGPDVLDAVRGADWDVNDAACRHIDIPSVKRHLCTSCNDHPMFCPMFMFLVAQPLFGKDLDALHFVIRGFIKNGEAAPRPFLVCHWKQSIPRPDWPQYALDWLMHH